MSPGHGPGEGWIGFWWLIVGPASFVHCWVFRQFRFLEVSILLGCSCILNNLLKSGLIFSIFPLLSHFSDVFWPFLRPQNRGLAFYCPPETSASSPPPGLAKYHTFSGFFLRHPSLTYIMFLNNWMKFSHGNNNGCHVSTSVSCTWCPCSCCTCPTMTAGLKFNYVSVTAE